MGKIKDIILQGVTRSLTGAIPLGSLTARPCTGLISFYNDSSATSVVSAFVNAEAMEHYITAYNQANTTEATYSVDQYDKIKTSIHPFLKVTGQYLAVPKPSSVNWPPIDRASYTAHVIDVQINKTIRKTLKKATVTAFTENKMP
tara:strand:- start:1221 stop:1655 length:435 start_codon:yes stop_codon:yes gene_type:complete